MRVGLKPLKELGAVQVKLKSIFALKPIIEPIIEEKPEGIPIYVFIIYTGYRWNPDYQEYYGIIKFNKSDWSIDNKLEVNNYLISEYAHCIIRDDRLYIAPVKDAVDDRGLLIVNTSTNQVVKWIKFSHVLSDLEIYWFTINDMVVDENIAYILIGQYLCKIITEDETISLTDIGSNGTSLTVDNNHLWISADNLLQKRNKSDLSLIEIYEDVV